MKVLFFLLASVVIVVATSRGDKTRRRLSGKGSKGGKGKMKMSDGVGPDAEPASYLLRASMGAYPGYTGTASPSGIITARFNDDSTSMLFKLDVSGLETLCPECGAHIHVGTTCDDASMVGGHYWDTELFGETSEDDPWNYDFYQTNYLGRSTSGFVIDSGYGIENNTGRAVVLHGEDGTRVGCGILRPDAERMEGILYTDIGPYPGLNLTELGSIPVGEVEVEFFTDNTLRFSFDVTGLEPNCVDCGVHIHTGITCDDASLVYGHYWDLSEQIEDPWVSSEGAVYNTDDEGEATGSFFLFSGYGYDDSIGHAVVFHGQDGGRLGCGRLLRPST